MFESETYVERRRRLAADVGAEGSGLILLPGNELSPMNYPDNTFPFRQDSTFLYFFGLDDPGLFAVIDVDEGRAILFGDDPTIEDVVWMGPQPPLAEKAGAVGVTESAGRAALAGVVERALQAGRPVHWLPPYRGEGVLALQGLLGASPADVRAGASLALIRAVVAQRSIKSPAELAQIEQALEISHAMHTTAMRVARPGVVEQEVVGAVEGVVLGRGSHVSFPTIFTVHGETLHNHHHHNEMRAGDIVIHDSGAESPLHYASDITRTIPVGGRFDARQRDVYALVHAAQQAAIEAVRPGVPFRDVHRLACEVLAGGLVGMGLMKGDVQEAVEAGAHAMFFQCGLGHHMGLDVHDMEGLGEDHVGYTDEIRRNPLFGWKSLRLGRALEPGFVVTVEPGLYFIPQLMDLWEGEGRHRDFIDYDALRGWRDFGGVRLEDDVLVTADGHRVLGPPIPKALEEVEALAAG